MSAGCSNNDKRDAPTISINQDSDYEQTFNDLNLGVLFDFDFYLPHADERWVNLWVERYQDGKKDPEPLAELSYGNSPEEVDEGRLGFGMINPDSKDTMVFLYGPGISTQPIPIAENQSDPSTLRTSEFTIGKEEEALKLGKTIVLAVYRESGAESIRPFDVKDEESVKRVIQEDKTVLLLKLKVEEKNDK
jgi:hypothetical protein